MPRLPQIKPKRFTQLLKRLGFSFARQKGSHATYVHADRRIVVVSMHTYDIPLGTLRAMLKDIHLSPEEFRRLV
ncbi:MAG: type II toxin-antitoxin system HicA family toxin [Patescibacteria group bacterium]